LWLIRRVRWAQFVRGDSGRLVKESYGLRFHFDDKPDCLAG